MQVAVLVIIYRGKEHITLHESDAAAWSELVRFVDEHWATRSTGAPALRPDSEDDCVRLFFEGSGDSYILGNADLSEVEALVDASFGGAVSP